LLGPRRRGRYSLTLISQTQICTAREYWFLFWFVWQGGWVGYLGAACQAGLKQEVLVVNTNFTDTASVQHVSTGAIRV
jgi:hypothetical protein